MMDSGKVNAVELAKALITAYPSTHPALSPVDFECCGGNDEIFQEHTMDCPYLAKICIEGLLTERDELKGKLGKAVEALTWYSKHKIGVCRTECGTGLYEQVASEALKEISK